MCSRSKIIYGEYVWAEGGGDGGGGGWWVVVGGGDLELNRLEESLIVITQIMMTCCMTSDVAEALMMTQLHQALDVRISSTLPFLLNWSRKN